MKLTKAEQRWIDKLTNVLLAAPPGIGEKVSSFTIGDNNINIYDKVKFDEYFNSDAVTATDRRDHCMLVADADAELYSIWFPFSVESTSG